jgi:ubiquinone/menaquinone biosynthesis C-methylase UbiE
MSTPLPWELVAEGYAAEAAFVMQPFSLRAAEVIAPSSSARVLDVAAGPGTLALRLAPTVREVVAVDFSEKMIAELRQAAAELGLKNVQAKVADGERLPFGDGEFDAGFSLFGLMFFPDRASGFAELYRVLKPGAGAVVSSWAPVQESSLMRTVFGALSAADPDFSVPKTDPAGLENPEVLAGEMRSGGFERVRIEAVKHTLPRANADDLWARVARSFAPLVLMRSRLGEPEWQRREAIIRSYLAGAVEREPELSTTAWLAVGYKP